MLSILVRYAVDNLPLRDSKSGFPSWRGAVAVLNESGAPAHLIPIQDAGLHTYLRTLDIQFYHPHHESFISLKKH